MNKNFSFKVDKSKIDTEYSSIRKEYIKKFGHSVPTEMLPTHITKDEIISAIKQCLDEGEDRLLEILNVEINHDVLY